MDFGVCGVPGTNPTWILRVNCVVQIQTAIKKEKGANSHY